MRRSVAWVLDHSPSIWVGVIRDRMRRGVGPESMARLFAIGTDTFAEVRFLDHRPNLVLRVDHRPQGGAA